MKKIRVIFEKIVSEDQKEDLKEFAGEMMEKGYTFTMQKNPNICETCGSIKAPIVKEYICNDCNINKTMN